MDNRPLDYRDHQPAAEHFPLVILLDNLCNAANVGGIFRIADALGVAQLLLCGETVAPPDRRLERCSRSTHRAVSYRQREEPLMVAHELRAQGYPLIALELTQRSVDLREVDFRRFDKACLVLGGERRGICPALLEIVDRTVHIPMRGQNSSMNVTSACAIAVHEITRQLTSVTALGEEDEETQE